MKTTIPGITRYFQQINVSLVHLPFPVHTGPPVPLSFYFFFPQINSKRESELYNGEHGIGFDGGNQNCHKRQQGSPWNK